jgi:hypothetical protein
MAVDGKGAAFTTAGFIVLWSGIKGTTLKTTLTDLLKGQNPKAVAEGAPTVGVGSGSATATAATAPAVAAGGSYDTAQLEQLWTSSGGDASKASVAACIAMHESSGNADAESSNPDGGTNVGLWQLDTKGKGAGYTVAQLMDPTTNCHVAIMGSANGTDWSAWATAGDCGA